MVRKTRNKRSKKRPAASQPKSDEAGTSSDERSPGSSRTTQPLPESPTTPPSGATGPSEPQQSETRAPKTAAEQQSGSCAEPEKCTSHSVARKILKRAASDSEIKPKKIFCFLPSSARLNDDHIQRDIDQFYSHDETQETSHGASEHDANQPSTSTAGPSTRRPSDRPSMTTRSRSRFSFSPEFIADLEAAGSSRSKSRGASSHHAADVGKGKSRAKGKFRKGQETQTRTWSARSSVSDEPETPDSDPLDIMRLCEVAGAALAQRRLSREIDPNMEQAPVPQNSESSKRSAEGNHELGPCPRWARRSEGSKSTSGSSSDAPARSTDSQSSEGRSLRSSSSALRSTTSSGSSSGASKGTSSTELFSDPSSTSSSKSENLPRETDIEQTKDNEPPRRPDSPRRPDTPWRDYAVRPKARSKAAGREQGTSSQADPGLGTYPLLEGAVRPKIRPKAGDHEQRTSSQGDPGVASGSGTDRFLVTSPPPELGEGILANYDLLPCDDSNEPHVRGTLPPREPPPRRRPDSRVPARPEVNPNPSQTSASTSSRDDRARTTFERIYTDLSRINAAALSVESKGKKRRSKSVPGRGISEPSPDAPPPTPLTFDVPDQRTNSRWLNLATVSALHQTFVQMFSRTFQSSLANFRNFLVNNIRGSRLPPQRYLCIAGLNLWMVVMLPDGHYWFYCGQLRDEAEQPSQATESSSFSVSSNTVTRAKPPPARRRVKETRRLRFYRSPPGSDATVDQITSSILDSSVSGDQEHPELVCLMETCIESEEPEPGSPTTGEMSQNPEQVSSSRDSPRPRGAGDAAARSDARAGTASASQPKSTLAAEAGDEDKEDDESDSSDEPTQVSEIKRPKKKEG